MARWCTTREARTQFARRYTDDDVVLLAEPDSLRGTLSSAATCALAHHAWKVYGEAHYERLARISVSYLYNPCAPVRAM